MGKNKETKPKLLDESSSDSEVDFKVNTSYATAYDKWRQGEELQKLKDKYGSDVDSSSSSSDSEESVPVIEKDFLKTLSLLKSKDPQIYDDTVKFFKEENLSEKKPRKEKKPKPLYPKDYERQKLLEHNGEFSDSEDEIHKMKMVPPSYDEEQEEIRKSFKAALAESDAEDEEDDIEDDRNDDLLKVRQKDEKGKREEEEDYITWLKGEKDNLKVDESEDLEGLHNYWNDPKLDSDEKFLKDYILNKKYLEDDDSDEAIPTYEEITGTLSDDEELLEKQEMFEHKYNFRFEEPDQEFIKKYPRTVGDSLRRKDNKRKLKREEYQERKKREKEQKKEELKRLKALKRKEIEDKLEKLRETVGNEQLAFDDIDVDGDFDPEEHDRKMQKLFNDEFYDVEESEKPQFPSDEEVDVENWDNWTGSAEGGNENDGPHCEDPDFIMDADYNPKLAFQQQMLESSTKKNRRLKKKKSKFAEAVSKSKPVFDPGAKTFEKYVDEYYKLDCEDIIGDLPVRFKYRQVVPNDFGLTTEEILVANDRELNRWCSLKKTCQYRKEEEELYEVQAFRKKAENEALKKKVFLSLNEIPDEPDKVVNDKLEQEEPKKKKRKKKKKRNNSESNELSSENKEITEPNLIQSEDDKELAVGNYNRSSKDVSTPFSSKVSRMRNLEGESVEQKGHKRKRDNTQSCMSLDSYEHKYSSMDSLNEPSETVAQQLQHSSNSGPISSSTNAKKSKKKRKRQKISHGNGVGNKTVDHNSQNKGNENKFKKPESLDKRLLIPDSRLKAYGINPKKFKNKLKYSKKS